MVEITFDVRETLSLTLPQSVSRQKNIVVELTCKGCVFFCCFVETLRKELEKRLGTRSRKAAEKGQRRMGICMERD